MTCARFAPSWLRPVCSSTEPRSWAKLSLLLLSLAAALCLIVLLPGWCALWLVPLAAIPAVAAAMIGHEAGHGSFAAKRRHNEIVLHLVFPLFGGLGAQHWKHKHNHLHHGHPNVVGRDPDIRLWPLALSRAEHAASSRPRRWLQRRLQAQLFWPLTLLLAFSMRYRSWRHLVRVARAGRFGRAHTIDAACLAAHYALWLAMPALWFGLGPVLLLYGSLWAVGGLLLGLVFAPAHLGLPVLAADRRGGWEEQLETTRDLAMPRWLSWLFVGLDHQVEHHLFPRVPHQNLPRARVIVERWCRRGRAVPQGELRLGGGRGDPAPGGLVADRAGPGARVEARGAARRKLNRPGPADPAAPRAPGPGSGPRAARPIFFAPDR